MSNSTNWLLEDEDDIFVGSPKSKFFDIVKEASGEIVADEIDKIVEKFAAMELMLSRNKDESVDIYKDISQFVYENGDEVERLKKDLYIEFTGDIVCRLDS